MPQLEDVSIRLLKGTIQSQGRFLFGVLSKHMRNNLRCFLTRLLPHGVRAHTIRHQKNMSALQPLLIIAGCQGKVAVLIMAAPHADIGQTGVFDPAASRHLAHDHTVAVNPAALPL
ncbi:hypothetical protein HRbin36_01500 [bacterium HR36]|nr:hypothetical protein HRbin36_01500 [bacterium HR36]